MVYSGHILKKWLHRFALFQNVYKNILQYLLGIPEAKESFRVVDHTIAIYNYIENSLEIFFKTSISELSFIHTNIPVWFVCPIWRRKLVNSDFSVPDWIVPNVILVSVQEMSCAQRRWLGMTLQKKHLARSNPMVFLQFFSFCGFSVPLDFLLPSA